MDDLVVAFGIFALIMTALYGIMYILAWIWDKIYWRRRQ